MRRRLSQLLVVTSTMLVTMFFVAGPVMAAGEAKEEQAAEGFGTGQFDATLVAVIAAVFLGAIVFAMSNPGDIERVGHDDHH